MKLTPEQKKAAEQMHRDLEASGKLVGSREDFEERLRSDVGYRKLLRPPGTLGPSSPDIAPS